MTSPNTSTLEATESFDVSKDVSVDKLHAKAIGLIGVLFLTVTGAAPESAMLGNVPFAAGFGNGIYVPAAFLLATVVLTIFSVGYAAMASKVSSVGGFYSFISLGLGRDVGMAAGIASLACYSIFEASLTGLFAYFGNQWIQTHFGINVPWLYLALFVIALTSFLSYQDVQLSVKVLGAALVFEVVMLTIFDVGVLVAKGPGAFNLEALNVFNVLTPVAAQKVGTTEIAAGAAAVGVFMAFWSWVGFEMAPNYAEESVDPKRIIPKSLYYSVIGLGIFYILTSWAAISAYPTEGDMLAKAVGDSSNFFLAPLEQFVGGWAKEAMFLLILTSSFACSMAFHNTAARYMYSLGREGVLPKFLGKTHPTHKSPHVASVVQTLLAVLWVGLFAFFYGTNDPNAQAYLGVYTMFAVLGTMLLLILQAVVSIAIIIYFRANHPGEVNIFAGLIAPVIAFISQVYLVYLLVANLETFGGTGGFGGRIPLIAFIILGVGLVWGLALRVVSPEAHARIGRMVLNE